MFFDGGLVGQDLVRGELLARGEQRRLGALQCGLRVRDLFARHRARAGDGLAAAQVFTRLGDVGLAQCHVGGERSVVDVERADFTHGLGELGFGLLQRHLRIGAVELDQRLACRDELCVVRSD